MTSHPDGCTAAVAAPTPTHLRACQAYHYAVAEHVARSIGDVVERADVTSGAFPQLTTLFVYMAHVVGLVPVPMLALYLTASESQVLSMVRDAQHSFRIPVREPGVRQRGIVSPSEARAIKRLADRMLGGTVPL